MIHLPRAHRRPMDGPHPTRIHPLVMPWRGFWRSTWSRRKRMGGHWFPFEMFLFGLLFVAVPYFASNNIAAHPDYLGTVWDPEIWLDRQIPVVNWMIIPYAALYLFDPATLVVSPRDDRGRAELILAMQGLILITLFCRPKCVDASDRCGRSAPTTREVSTRPLHRTTLHPTNLHGLSR